MPQSIIEKFRIFILPPLLLLSILLIFILPLSTQEYLVEALICLLFVLSVYNLIQFTRKMQLIKSSYLNKWVTTVWVFAFFCIGSFGVFFLYAAYTMNRGGWG